MFLIPATSYGGGVFALTVGKRLLACKRATSGCSATVALNTTSAIVEIGNRKRLPATMRACPAGIVITFHDVCFFKLLTNLMQSKPFILTFPNFLGIILNIFYRNI